jgi:hypothetical protein
MLDDCIGGTAGDAIGDLGDPAGDACGDAVGNGELLLHEAQLQGKAIKGGKS